MMMETIDTSFQGVVDRLVSACSLPNEQALAEELGFKQSTFATRKMRGALPRAEIDVFIAVRGLNPEWVYEGRGSMVAGKGRAKRIQVQAVIDERLAPFALNKRQKSYMTDLLMALELAEPQRLKSLLDEAKNITEDERLLVGSYRVANPHLKAAFDGIRGAISGSV